ncbi:MAG: hypothetical protein IJZ18_04315, partial [Mailhella sp.]|nr:hypothetical protein [Mailhella sp.]
KENNVKAETEKVVPERFCSSVSESVFHVKHSVSDNAENEDEGSSICVPSPPRLAFSMKNMRCKRLSGVEWRPKKDADEVFVKEDQRNRECDGTSPEVQAGDLNATSMMFHVKHSGMKVPALEEIENAFSTQGLIGAMFDHYEARDEQVEMSKAVLKALEDEENLSVEAGTGVGKSMAYLVPLALISAANDINVGVATKTNALLDQLMYQELPKLQSALAKRGLKFSYSSLKGFSHYPCLRKIERIMKDGPRKRLVGQKECSQAPALAALVSFVEQTEYDDIDSLKIDYRTLPRKSVTTTSHECLRRKCPYYGMSCFVHGSRRKAESSHVVVTNHSLFYCDLAADNGLLPPIRYWVVDEAHGAEAEARRAFSLSLPADEMVNLAQRVSSDDSSKNAFVRAERTVVPASQTGAGSGTLFFALTNKAKGAGREFSGSVEEFCLHMRDLLVFDPSKRAKGYESVDLWINETVRSSDQFRGLIGFGKIMVEKAEKLVTACQELVAYLEDAENASSIQREIASIAMELKDIIRAAETILFNPNERYVYSALLNKKADRPG